ncbi:unnamed protein product [Rotaria sordida]|uniref:Uncharacterized protein n=1 Tax=Rotaria sordida TaxID=392033 RepID=A0A813Z1A3_9BILA|nr:unnamed protein product [Rotaria sordida]CAF0891720.1 unnamed protein product [Rotaria sordida]
MEISTGFNHLTKGKDAYAYHLSDAKKRSIETEPRLFSALVDFYAQVVYPPLNHIVQNMALLSAQVLAGIAQTGIPAPGGRTIHLSNVELRDFIDDLWNNAVKPPLQNAIQGLSLMAAQALAGIGVNGINLSNLFVLAGIGTNGVNLSSLFGKRDLSELASRQAEIRGFFDTLGNGLLNGLQTVWTNIVQGPIEQALQSGALMAAQVLAGIGTNGIDLGKRQLNNDARGEIIDNLVGHATGLYTNQVKPVVENALNSAILHLAGILANFSQSGIGRR